MFGVIKHMPTFFLVTTKSQKMPITIIMVSILLQRTSPPIV